MGMLDFISDMAGAAMGQQSAAYANRTNLKNAREQREWEANMSNTAVQRRADDMEKAGFNRLLAATGTGASTPSVAPATAQSTFDPSWTKGAWAAAKINTAQLANLMANTDKTKADKTLSEDLAAKARSETLGIQTSAAKAKRETELLDTAQQEALARIRKLGTEQAILEIERDIKNKTREESAQIIRQAAQSGKLDMTRKENEQKVQEAIQGLIGGKRPDWKEHPAPYQGPLNKGGRKTPQWKPRSHVGA